MRIITLNVNGIRAGARKGLFTWLARTRADVVCFQEIKAQHADLSDAVFNPRTWRTAYYCAEKKGYSGVAIWSRHKVQRWEYGFNCPEFDAEGRYLAAHFDGLSVVSLYAPSGSSGDDRQAAKYRFMDAFYEHLRKRRKRRMIICGDWNIAHKEIDLKNWRGNRKNSGFLPEERAWMDAVFYKFLTRRKPRVAQPYHIAPSPTVRYATAPPNNWSAPPRRPTQLHFRRWR